MNISYVVFSQLAVVECLAVYCTCIVPTHNRDAVPSCSFDNVRAMNK